MTNPLTNVYQFPGPENDPSKDETKFNFSSPAQWADYYRSIQLIVVPAILSTKPTEKFPTVDWKEHQKGVSQPTHDGWFRNTPSFSMGFLTGSIMMINGKPKRMFVVDLDTKSGGFATWRKLLETYNGGLDLISWEVRTGTGGCHLYLACDPNRVPKTRKNVLAGVDVRGDRGFIMAPPSPHYIPGTSYEWVVAPRDAEILEAPDWLLEALNGPGEVATVNPATVRAQSKTPLQPAPTVTSTRLGDHFTKDDHREDAMFRWVWARCLDTYRVLREANGGVHPSKPTVEQEEKIAQDLMQLFARHNRPKERMAGESDLDGLQREGRGITEMRKKVHYAIQDWDVENSKFRVEAAKDNPNAKEEPASKASKPGTGGGDGGGPGDGPGPTVSSSGAKQSPLANYANVIATLRASPEWKGVLAYDEFSQQRILKKPIPRRDGHIKNDFTQRALESADLARALEWFQNGDMPRLAVDKLQMALEAFAEENSYHPVRDYFSELPPWDKVPRIGTLFQDYFGTKPTSPEHAAYLSAVARAFLISAVARIMRPGCQADYVPVLEGPQGVKKSSFSRIMAVNDKWFTDTMPEPGTKDAADHVRGKWFVELPELAQLRKADVEVIKAFITRREERFRPAYGKFEVTYPRQCVFIGTTNADDYLRDDSGNRRFWPVPVVELNEAKLIKDRAPIWAEVYAAYKAGEKWYLDDAIEAVARQEQASRKAEEPWSERIQGYARHRDTVSVTEFLENGLGIGQGIQPSHQTLAQMKRVAAVLKDMKWFEKRGRVSGVQVRLWHRPT